LGASATAAGVKWTDVAIVASQATAEIFLSAVLGIYMTILYQRHRPVRLAENPLFGQLELERRSVAGEIEQERLALAEARGGESRLQNQMTALAAYARSLYQREAASRRDQLDQKTKLLDQISEQLRGHFQPANSHSLPGIERGAFELGREHAGNGK
jgi:hypothetical protein